MRLLVYDPEYISHSTDVVRKGLLPELARRVERLVWMLPESRHRFYQEWLAREPAIELAGFAAHRGSPGRWLDAILRRLEIGCGKDGNGIVPRLRRRLQARSGSSKAREMNATWIFCPSFMNQPVPISSIPLAGMIYDVSNTLSVATLGNMDRWVTSSAITFCISEFTRQQVLARLPRTEAHRLMVAPLCPAAMAPRSSGTEREIPRSFGAGPLRVLCPAAFSERKGQGVLLEAVRRNLDRGVRIDLVFSGALTESMKDSRTSEPGWADAARRSYQTLVDAGCPLRALGQVNDEELEALFREADVVVLPSLYEGFGLPVAEAVQRGLPVIASDLPPIREQLELFDCRDRVRLVPPGDAASLADALADFAAGGAPARKSSGAMAAHFARWTWEHVAERIVARLVS